MLLATILIAAAVLSVLLVPLLGPREPWDLDASPDRLRTLKRARDRVMRTLKDLQNDREEGALEESDYAALRDAYKRQAIELTRQLAVVRETVIRQIRSHGQALTGSERRKIESLVARRSKKKKKQAAKQ